MSGETTLGRRRNMAAIRSKDTKPELYVRRELHRLGFRYRTHRSDLPGRPDLVFPARRKIIEVRGCFWHAHGCALGQIPTSRLDYWGPKLIATKERDARNLLALVEQGWTVVEIWECEVRADGPGIIGRLVDFLEAQSG
jgi:DNA mismatch endonuclease Vsr